MKRPVTALALNAQSPPHHCERLSLHLIATFGSHVDKTVDTLLARDPVSRRLARSKVASGWESDTIARTFLRVCQRTPDNHRFEIRIG